MQIQDALKDVLQEQCPSIHNNRLNAVIDIAEGLRESQNLSMAGIFQAMKLAALSYKSMAILSLINPGISL